MKHLSSILLLIIPYFLANSQASQLVFLDTEQEYLVGSPDMYTSKTEVGDNGAVIQSKYFDGNITSSTEFKSDKLEVKNGKFISFYQNGEKEIEGVYKNDKRIGDWNSWYPNKQLKAKEMFNENGKILPQDYVKYYPEGSIDTKGSYSKKGKEGEWFWYFLNGTKSCKRIYKADNLISSECWDEAGNKAADCEEANINAEFVGGNPALFQFLGNNVKYPEEARLNKTEGTVYVGFLVEKNGEISAIQIKRGVHPLLDAEAIRVTSLMSTWKPGKLYNRLVRCPYTLPFKFKLTK